MCVHVKRCCVVWFVCVQSGQRGEVYCVVSILCRYWCRRGHLPVRSCASVLRVLRGSVVSDVCISGGCDCVILLCCLFCRYCVTAVVCICFMFCL